VILKAIATLRRRINCPPLVLVGAGPAEAEIIALARSLQLRVCFKAKDSSSVGDHDIYIYPFAQIDRTPVFYGLADAFLLASKVEEWGLVVNEAMAARLPVIVSSAAGCAHDLVEHGANGFLFDPYSIESLTSCLEVLVLDPSMRERMGHRSAELVANWGPELFAKNALAAAHVAMGGAPRASDAGLLPRTVRAR
jgi:glycosyltransferase involved in cell wall biosynthesis